MLSNKGNHETKAHSKSAESSYPFPHTTASSQSYGKISREKQPIPYQIALPKFDLSFYRLFQICRGFLRRCLPRQLCLGQKCTKLIVWINWTVLGSPSRSHSAEYACSFSFPPSYQPEFLCPWLANFCFRPSIAVHWNRTQTFILHSPRREVLYHAQSETFWNNCGEFCPLLLSLVPPYARLLFGISFPTFICYKSPTYQFTAHLLSVWLSWFSFGCFLWFWRRGRSFSIRRVLSAQ